MKISHKLISSFLLVASVASLSIFLTVRAYREIDAEYSRLMADPIPTIAALNGLKQSGIRIISSTSEYGFIRATADQTDDSAPGETGEDDEEQQLIEQGRQGFETALAEYTKLAQISQQDEKRLLEGISAAGGKLVTTSDEIIALIKNDASADKILRKRSEFEVNEVAFLKVIDEALAEESAQAAKEQENVQTTIARATERTLTVGASTFLLAIIAGLYISFSISRRLRKLAEASQKVGGGELDTQIDINSRDEIGDLAHSFNAMIGDLRRSRGNLAARELHFRALIENSSDAIALFDADGKMLYASPSTPHILGFTLDEIMTLTAIELIEPDDREAFRARLSELIANPGATVHMIDRIRHKDGSTRWLEGTFTNLLHVPHVGAIVNNYRDITVRKAAEIETMRLNVELERARERISTIVGNVQGVVWETKTKIEKGETFLRFDFVSDYIETMLGYSADDCASKPGFWLEIIHPDDRTRTEQVVRSIFAGGKGGTVEFRWIARDGREVWVESRNTIIRDDTGQAVGLRGIAVDITERKTLEQQLTHQALHDPLTGLANRVLFLDRVKHAVSRTGRNRTDVTVLFLDLDNFKAVNDTLGHAAGDELLMMVSERLQASLRVSDTPARLGGDEFAVLIEDTEQDEAIVIAERIRTVLGATFNIGGTEVYISASIGLATRCDETETPEELIRNADVAMYRSKGNGKDQYTVFENEMHDVLVKRLRLESDMRSSIEARQFEVYYQPIIELDTERVMGMEALVRWNHPEHGLIPPVDFIPLAEETGLIVPLGKWILNEACLQAARWQTEHGRGSDLSITVNIAGRQFLDDSLLGDVEQALANSELPPHSLVLEITESTMLANTETTQNKMIQLKALGIRLAIDDFGTGYSSLSYLQRFPVDILKIDKSFIDKIVSGKEGAAVARAIITLSETLHLETIAEGIENVGQQHELQGLGCELGQGYLFAKPLKARAMSEFLRRGETASRETPALPVKPATGAHRKAVVA